MNIDFDLLAEQKQHLVTVLWENGTTLTADQHEALNGILHLLDALGDEQAEPTDDEPVQSTKVRVRFRPQAWIRNNAVDVDAAGVPVWFIEVDSEGPTMWAYDAGRDLDFLKFDPFAPQWVADYDGPFEIELVED